MSSQNVFVIHKFADRKIARNLLKQICKDNALFLNFHLLDSANDNKWKLKAEKLIKDSDFIIVFNPIECYESKNPKWEIEKAKSLGKKIIEIDKDNNKEAIMRLVALSNNDDEFSKCFNIKNENKDELLALYKMMVDSSENLVQRRQTTNTFFVTIIGVFITIGGYIYNTGKASSYSIIIVGIFAIACIILCLSWKNLIDNFGKLNKAKFDVILRLENELSARIYGAEWIALGKGKQPKKYKTFTKSEKIVPICFIILVCLLLLALIVDVFISNDGADVTNVIVSFK